MGRSSVEQALQNRAKIIQEASRLFRERGVESVSVSEIMASAGMTTGGFYKHFASKDALVQEACALSFEQALSRWRRLGEDDDGAAGTNIEAIVHHYLKERPADQTCPMLAYGPEISAEDTSSMTRATYSHGAEELFDLFTESSPEVKKHRDPKAKPEQDTAILFAAMVGAKLLVQATKGSTWSQALLEAVKGRATEGAAGDGNVSRTDQHRPLDG